MGNADLDTWRCQLGRDIHTVNRGQLKTDFASLLIAMLDAKGAGDERRALLERTMRGRDKKLALGKIVRSPKSPYGYMYEEDTLAIDETEAAIVRMIPGGISTGMIKPVSQ